MPAPKGIILTPGTLAGLSFIHKYRFLTIPQFAAVAGVSIRYAGEILYALTGRHLVNFFGFTSIPGQGRTPKVYFLTRRGFELLREESRDPETELSPFQEVHAETSWSPQMYHRLRVLDLFIALETQVRSLPHLALVRTFLEYRRLPGSHVRETADYVTDQELPEHRIIPDGGFVLENRESGRRGLFFVEMDMGTERIVAARSADRRATIRLKFEQYDRYLTSGRFSKTYARYGDFRRFTLLFVTTAQERLENIREASMDLPERLHPYYRLTTFPEAQADFLGPVWKSRDPSDTLQHALVAKRSSI